MAESHNSKQSEAPKDCKCAAYETFSDTITSIKKNYSELGPLNGKVCGVKCDPPGPLSNYGPPEEPTMEFIRGGMISVIATWEGYVHDLLTEAFDVLLSIGGNDVAKLREIWPKFDNLYQNAFQHRVDAGKNSAAGSSQKAAAAKVATELLYPESWSDLVMDECKYQLKQLTQLRFIGSNGIDEAFSKIFQSRHGEKKLSDRVLDMGINYEFRYLPGPKCADKDNVVRVQISADEGKQAALDDLLRLYYGVRCVFAHGKADKTLLKGALKDFPEKPEDLKVNSKAAERLVALYQRVKTYRRSEIWVNYFMLVNMYRFIENVGKCLCRAIAEWFDEIFKKKVWEDSIQSMPPLPECFGEQ